MSIDRAVTELIDSFAKQKGAQNIFAANALETSLKKNGFDSVTVTSASNTRLAFSAKANSAQRVFNAVPNAVSYSPRSDSKSAALTITLSPETTGEILALFPPETIEYLAFFLSPLLTPDAVDSDGAMTQESYLADIKAVYGANIASALGKSEFSFSFTAPGTITSMTLPPFAQVSTNADNITLTMPLSALLSVSRQAVFGIGWN